MDILGFVNSIRVTGKYLTLALFVMMVANIAMADTTGGLTNVSNAMKDLCYTARNFLGISAMLLVVLAGAVYAIGQVLGAETRAKAAVWATAMLTGAVIGIIIYLIVPTIIHSLFPNDSSGGRTVTLDASDPCGFTAT